MIGEQKGLHREKPASVQSVLYEGKANYLARNMAILLEGLQAPCICRFFHTNILILPAIQEAK